MRKDIKGFHAEDSVGDSLPTLPFPHWRNLGKSCNTLDFGFCILLIRGLGRMASKPPTAAKDDESIGGKAR